MKSAPVAILIIGDEVLSAKTKDANGPYLLERLNKVGARIQELRIIRDDVAVIRDTLRFFLDAGCNIITTGGVGPTHDDRTMEAVAAALGIPLAMHNELLALLTDRVGDRPSAPLLRMCQVPQGAELVGSGLGFPAVMADRVLILPGIPELVQDKFPRIEQLYAAQARPCGALFIDIWESRIAPVLNTLVAQEPDLDVGSYPRISATGFRVIVTVEHADRARVRKALQQIEAGLDKQWIVHQELPFGGLRDQI